jgi:aldose sugar dehydrogenase
MAFVAQVLVAALFAWAAGCESIEPQVEDETRTDDPVEQPPQPEATHGYRVVEVVGGLAHPWAVAFLPGGDMLITERAGRVRLVRGGALVAAPVSGAPAVRAAGQGGLLDIALHPDFATNRLVYLSYAKAVTGGATTALARARWENDRLEGLEDVFVARAVSGAGQHFGSRIVFDRDGFLYLTIGDRGDGRRAQDLSDHVGTTIRLHDDGRVPADNPFVGRSGAQPEIFTYGNRNAQGMAVHPGTGEVWQNEHGPRGGDEINRMLPGRNYGWPEYNYGNHYDGRPIPDHVPGAGMELPLLHWTPSIAPSGMMFYTGDRFPNWRGSVFTGALAGRHLRRVVFDGDRPVHQEQLLRDFGQRIRDVRQGPDGYIYVLTDSPDAVLARLEPTGD